MAPATKKLSKYERRNGINVRSHLFLHFLSDSCKSDCCVDIFAIDHVGDIREDPWLPVNELIQDVFLQSCVVILDILSFSKGQGVVAVRENDGKQLVLVVHQVAAMDMSDGNLVLTPKFFTNKSIPIVIAYYPL